MDNIRLPKAKWEQLDGLLGEHGFGGYYDLVECLKIVGGNIGLWMSKYDSSDSYSLPDIMNLLLVWSQALSSIPEFDEVVKIALHSVDTTKGGERP